MIMASVRVTRADARYRIRIVSTAVLKVPPACAEQVFRSVDLVEAIPFRYHERGNYQMKPEC